MTSILTEWDNNIYLEPVGTWYILGMEEQGKGAYNPPPSRFGCGYNACEGNIKYFEVDKFKHKSS